MKTIRNANTRVDENGNRTANLLSTLVALRNFFLHPCIFPPLLLLCGFCELRCSVEVDGTEEGESKVRGGGELTKPQHSLPTHFRYKNEKIRIYV